MISPVRVSIAMATFNGASHLKEQLDSLAAQTHPPFELVVTDDGSTDHTRNIVTAFAINAPFPVHLHTNDQRLGYRKNFMRAVSFCAGEVIAFCDQDDIWYPEKLSRVENAFSDPGVMLFHHEARIIRNRIVVDERLRKVGPQIKLTPALGLAPWRFSPGFTQAFRTGLRTYDSLWPQSIDFRMPNEVEAHDEWYYFLGNSLGSTVFCDEPLADYRQHEMNVYGAGETKRSRLGYLLENRIDMFQRLSRAAESRSQILQKATSIVGQAQKERACLMTAAAAWHSLALLYEKRTSLYECNLIGRVMALLALVKAGAYSTRGFWCFGRKAFTKDIVLGLFLASVVRRYGLPAIGDDWSCAAGRRTASSRK